MVTIQVLIAGLIPGYQSANVGDVIRVPGVIGLAAVLGGIAERLD